MCYNRHDCPHGKLYFYSEVAHRRHVASSKVNVGVEEWRNRAHGTTGTERCTNRGNTIALEECDPGASSTIFGRPFIKRFALCYRTVVMSVAFYWRKPPIFAVFWTSAFSVVANWQQSDKVEHVCTTTNLPLSNGIKIVSVVHRLHGEIGRTISDVQKRDEQTNRQTDKKLNVFRRSSGG